MKVESISESPWSILQYFWPALSDNWSSFYDTTVMVKTISNLIWVCNNFLSTFCQVTWVRKLKFNLSSVVFEDMAIWHPFHIKF